MKSNSLTTASQTGQELLTDQLFDIRTDQIPLRN